MSQATETPLPEPVRRALKLLFLIVAIDLLGFGLMIPLLPFYALRFEATALTVTLLGSAYSFSQLIASPLLGMLSDRIGRRPVLVLSQLGSAAGFLLLAFAALHEWTNLSAGLSVLFLARILDGISGGNVSAAQAFISDITPPDRRARGMGLLGAAFGIGFATGPAIGGLLGSIHPSVPAFLAAGCSIAAATLSFLRLPESRPNPEPVTPPEPLLEDAPEMPDPVTRGGLLALLSSERVRSVFRHALLCHLLLAWFWCMFAFVMLEIILPLFLEVKFGFGPRGVGLFFGMAGITIIVVQGVLIGRLTRRFGEWPIVIVGPALVAVAMGLLVQVSSTPWLPLLLLAGLTNAVGRSLMMPSMSSLLSKSAPPDRQGVAFGLFHGLGSLSRVFGPILAGALFERSAALPFVAAGMIAAGVALWMAWLRARYGERGRSLPAPAVVAATDTASVSAATGNPTGST